MPDYFRRVRAGEPFKPAAPTWNAMLDAAQAHHANKKTGGAPGDMRGESPGIVDVYNASGQDVGVFGILGLDGDVLANPVLDLQTYLQRPTLRGVTPANDHHLGRFVVTMHEIPAGGIGRAIISGMAIVRVATVHGDHRRATVKPGDTTQLQSSDAGTEIVYVAGGAGTRWGLIRMGMAPDPGTLFAVILDQATGHPGNATTPCSFVYTIKSLGGRIMATNASPVRPRLLNAVHVAATSGTAYIASDGSVVLHEAFETLQQTNCE